MKRILFIFIFGAGLANVASARLESKSFQSRLQAIRELRTKFKSKDKAKKNIKEIVDQRPSGKYEDYDLPDYSSNMDYDDGGILREDVDSTGESRSPSDDSIESEPEEDVKPKAKKPEKKETKEEKLAKKFRCDPCAWSANYDQPCLSRVFF